MKSVYRVFVCLLFTVNVIRAIGSHSRGRFLASQYLKMQQDAGKAKPTKVVTNFPVVKRGNRRNQVKGFRNSFGYFPLFKTVEIIARPAKRADMSKVKGSRGYFPLFKASTELENPEMQPEKRADLAKEYFPLFKTVEVIEEPEKRADMSSVKSSRGYFPLFKSGTEFEIPEMQPEMEINPVKRTAGNFFPSFFKKSLNYIPIFKRAITIPDWLSKYLKHYNIISTESKKDDENEKSSFKNVASKKLDWLLKTDTDSSTKKSYFVEPERTTNILAGGIL